MQRTLSLDDHRDQILEREREGGRDGARESMCRVCVCVCVCVCV